MSKQSVTNQGRCRSFVPPYLLERLAGSEDETQSGCATRTHGAGRGRSASSG